MRAASSALSAPRTRRGGTRGHEVDAPEAVRDTRGFGNVEAVMWEAHLGRHPLQRRPERLSLCGASAGGCPRRTPQTRSLYSYPRDKACNETTCESGWLARKREHACPG